MSYLPEIATIIGTIALFRPEISHLAHKIYGKIELFPFPRIELGYGIFGPTITVPMTILAKNGNKFIEKIDVEISKNDDNRTQTFSWLFFKNTKGVKGVGEQVEATYARSFALRSGDSNFIEVVASEKNTEERIKEKLGPLQLEWQACYNKALGDGKLKDRNDVANLFANFQKNNSKRVLEDTKSLERLCFWDGGDWTCFGKVESTCSLKSSKKGKVHNEFTSEAIYRRFQTRGGSSCGGKRSDDGGYCRGSGRWQIDAWQMASPVPGRSAFSRAS